MILWRISNHQTLDGSGGLRAGGRWHSRGHRVVYCALSPASALLEILVHLEIDVDALPLRYRLLRVDAPDDLPREQVSVEDLPPDWTDRPAFSRRLGDAWLSRAQSPLLQVPSALVPATWNMLVNPRNADARRIRILGSSQHLLDPRLLEPRLPDPRAPDPRAPDPRLPDPGLAGR